MCGSLIETLFFVKCFLLKLDSSLSKKWGSDILIIGVGVRVSPGVRILEFSTSEVGEVSQIGVEWLEKYFLMSNVFVFSL